MFATAPAKLLPHAELRETIHLVYAPRRPHRGVQAPPPQSGIPLTDVDFDIERASTSQSDIQRRVRECRHAAAGDAVSPYFTDHMDKITVDISSKAIVSAVKGIVPDTNELITDYMVRRFGVDPDATLWYPACHAEEVARQAVLPHHRLREPRNGRGLRQARQEARTHTP